MIGRVQTQPFVSQLGPAGLDFHTLECHKQLFCAIVWEICVTARG